MTDLPTTHSERVQWVVHVDQDDRLVFDFGWITSRDFDMARKTKIPGGHRFVVKETRER